MQGQKVESELPEYAGYFPVAGEHLYTMLHEVSDPVARVLLVGPFASERQNAYLPWVRWARHLAGHGIEVLRYDYRGVGESTGSFEDMTFADWEEGFIASNRLVSRAVTACAAGAAWIGNRRTAGRSGF